MEKISIENEIFESFRSDIDNAMSDAIKDMIRYDVTEGKISVTLKISTVDMAVVDPETGILDNSIVPTFEHSIKYNIKHEGNSFKGNSTGMTGIRLSDGSVFLSKVHDSQETLF